MRCSEDRSQGFHPDTMPSPFSRRRQPARGFLPGPLPATAWGGRNVKPGLQKIVYHVPINYGGRGLEDYRPCLASGPENGSHPIRRVPGHTPQRGAHLGRDGARRWNHPPGFLVGFNVSFLEWSIAGNHLDCPSLPVSPNTESHAFSLLVFSVSAADPPPAFVSRLPGIASQTASPGRFWAGSHG